MAQKNPETFDRYPFSTILITNLISLSIYFCNLYLLYIIHPLLSLLFLVFIIYLELSLYRSGCANCYYYGKLCAFGRGSIAKLFFKKGDPKKFSQKQMKMKDMLIQFLPAIIPALAGVYLVITSFRWWLLIPAFWPLVVSFLGNPVMYGKLACPHCKQLHLGCPACEFFMKRAKKK
jgi:hypothetical protein